MAFTLTKKPAVANSESGEVPAGEAQEKPAASKPSGGAAMFMKSGAEAKKAFDKSEAESKARKEKGDKPWPFFLKSGEDANVTFLDGKIDPATGILDIHYLNLHRVKVDSRWEDIVCIEDQEPCPLCAGGNYKTFVGLLTIIDHREREYEKDGKTVKAGVTRRLYIAKSETLKQLTKMAEKLPHGLCGVTYEVSRTGDRKAAVGDLYDRVGEHSYAEILEHFGADLAKVIDYPSALTVLSTAEMSKLGIGKKVSTFGSSKGKTADDINDDSIPW